jgi:hypothetical protein
MEKYREISNLSFWYHDQAAWSASTKSKIQPPGTSPITSNMANFCGRFTLLRLSHNIFVRVNPQFG